MKNLLLLIFVFSLSQNMSGQEEEVEVKEPKHFVGVTLAYGIVPKGASEDNLEGKGHVVPGVGADYIYRFAKRWEVGAMVDYELASYVIPRKEDLIRERAFIVCGVVAFKLREPWNVFGGIGAELEKHKSFFIYRLGTEYSFGLGKSGWVIPLGVFMDVKEGYENFSVSVGIGKTF